MTIRPTMRMLALATIATLALARAGADARQAPPAETLLGAALHAEEVESNFAGAIEIYKKVIADPKASRSVVARALLQIAGCYERLGQPEARATYERIVKDYADSGAIATTARTRLEALQAAGGGPTERVIATERSLGGIGVQRWSPDGRFVIGIQLTGSEFDGSSLVLRDVTTTTKRTLFSRPPGFAPGYWTFSPDSRHFAAIMPHAAPQSVAAQGIRGQIDLDSVPAEGVLVVGSIEAGAAHTVVEIPVMPAFDAFQAFSAPLAWSPDGRSLVYALPVSPLRTYEIEVMNVTTGARRPLNVRVTGTRATSPGLTWSPTGQEVLVHVPATAASSSDLRVINVATTGTRSLPPPGAAGARLRIGSWEANGEIAIRRQDTATPQVEETFLLSAETGRSRKTCSGMPGTGGWPLAAADMCGEITGDGARQVVWQQASKRLMIRDLATGTDRPLTSASGEEYSGVLSPDGRVEVFLSNRNGRWGLYSAEIGRAPVARPTRLSALDDLPNTFNIVNWTPDGLIAQVTWNEKNIIRVNVEPGTGKATSTERLTQDGIINHTPAVSPDGQHIAYWSQHGSRFGIAVMDSNGANERIILETLQDYPGLQPSWRSTSEVLFTPPPPDGYTRSLSATADGPPISRRVMSLNINTGASAAVADVPGMPIYLGLPKYLAASSEIVHLDPGYHTLRSRSLVDGSSRVIATFAGDVEVDSFLVSPDGRKVAYVLAQRYDNGRGCFSKAPAPATSVNDILTTCEMGILTIATGERTALTGLRSPQGVVAHLVAWSPDGRFLLSGLGRPQIMDTTTKMTQPLLAPNMPLSWDHTASWSPDGSFIVLGDQSQRFELRQWKGVR